jgi:hypothetical protein
MGDKRLGIRIIDYVLKKEIEPRGGKLDFWLRFLESKGIF